MIQCNLSFTNPIDHQISISLTFPKVKKGTFEIILPAWRPGRYELADYTQNISAFKVAGQDTTSIQWNKTKPNVWRIDNPTEQDLSINYKYFANKMDAGNSVINEEQIYVNFINCIFYNETRLSEQIEVNILLPESYSCMTSLQANSKNKYLAIDYLELVDAPILASDQLHRISYQVEKSTFHIVFMGEHPLNEEEIINDFTAFTKKQIHDMEGFPTSEYYFLIQSLPYKHYHGVEHQNSTVLVLGPNTLENKETYKEMLLGVASHELFHTWNVTRIRPKELSPYNFKQEVLFDTGFVAEGFTTYYGDYYLKTSHVFNDSEYFKEVNTLLKRHFENYGRHDSSLIESSLNLWIDGYKNIYPSKKVSIYVKGALNALIIDLNIRKHTHNKKSLIDVINVLYNKHTYTTGGYTKEDVYHIVNKIASPEIGKLLQLLTESTEPLEKHLVKALEYVGYSLADQNQTSLITQKLGIRLSNHLIIDIAPKSTASLVLSIGDEIILINNQKPNEIMTIDNEVKIQVKRNGYEKIVNLVCNTGNHYKSYSLEQSKEPTIEQNENLKLWLNN